MVKMCIRDSLKDVPYPFSNKKEKGLVSIPKSAKRKQSFLNVNQMTELYNLFVSKQYPEHWTEAYMKRAPSSLGPVSYTHLDVYKRQPSLLAVSISKVYFPHGTFEYETIR